MKLTIILCGIGAMLSVTGCASTFRGAPTVSQASPGGVTYRIKGPQLSRAQSLADAHCATYGRRAVQDRVTRAEGNDRIASFNCI